jgi:hypothetical protein
MPDFRLSIACLQNQTSCQCLKISYAHCGFVEKYTLGDLMPRYIIVANADLSNAKGSEATYGAACGEMRKGGR